jgi:chromosome segregation ATPase
MTTTETPLIVAEKRALEEELHTLKMSFYDRREADTEIESFKQTIKQLEEKIEQLRNECQELYKQKHEYAEEQIARTCFCGEIKRCSLLRMRVTAPYF